MGAKVIISSKSVSVFLFGKQIGNCWVSGTTIYGVQIAKQYRRLGYGTRMMRAAMRIGGYDLFVAPFNQPDMTKEQTGKWYQSLGFDYVDDKLTDMKRRK